MGKFILGPFSGFLGVYQTLHFDVLSVYLDYFFSRKMVRTWETPQNGLFNFSSDWFIGIVCFLVSRRSRWRPKDSRPSICTSVRTYVTRLLENRSLLFSETLQSVRACKCEKNVPSAFLKNPVLVNSVKIWNLSPKYPKCMFFTLLSTSVH